MNKYKKHFLKRYKKRLRSDIIKDVLHISCEDIDALKMDNIPDFMFQSSAFSSDSIINNGELDSLKFSIGYASVAINLLGVCKYCKNNLIKDSYIFPALYCFRIYMENIMKESILLFKTGVNIDDLKKHGLESLWEMLTPYMQADNITKKIRKLILEFEKYDPDSTAFRYSHLVNRQLGKSKGKLFSASISIETLRSSMLFIYRFLEGVNEIARMTKDINE
ncbi:MAG: hypothetical protein KBS94_00525 [Prevotella sp.]|nr:hypothetical protein [Candidatus Equicola faecalis]